MQKNLLAKSSIQINSSKSEVWKALTDPEKIKKYMFGTEVTSEWKEGGSIFWKGEWEGKKYEDMGIIIKYKPNKLLEYSHFSPMSGLPDEPENYHKVTIELHEKDKFTEVVLFQDNNQTETERENSEKNWNMMLEGLKKLIEQKI